MKHSSSLRPRRLWRSSSTSNGFPRGYNGRDVKLATHKNVVLKLKICGDIRPFLHTFIKHRMNSTNLFANTNLSPLTPASYIARRVTIYILLVSEAFVCFTFNYVMHSDPQFIDCKRDKISIARITACKKSI